MKAIAAALACAFAVPGFSDTYVDNFDTTNAGNWEINGPGSTSAGTLGGNTYLKGTPDTWGVNAYSELGGTSPFLGNYRTRGVTSVGADIRIDYADFPNLGSRPFTLGLVNDGGTPFEFDDDVMVYTMGANIPSVGAGWASYDFAIDANAASLPGSWSSYHFDGGDIQASDWSLVISDVDRVELMFYNPEGFYIFQNWEVGIDNIRISTVPEPGALAALGLGAAALLRRRRK